MRTTLLIAALLTSLGASAQKLPTITLDSTIKAPEFYAGMYLRKANLHRTSRDLWILENNFKLYFKQSSCTVQGFKQFVGYWKVQNDSLTLTVSKPRPMGLSEPTHFKYRPFQLEWSTDTGFKDEDTGEPFVIKSVTQILADRPDFDMQEALLKLNLYLKTNFKDNSQTEEDEAMRDWDAHFQVDELVIQYFNEERIVVRIRHYNNGKLSKY